MNAVAMDGLAKAERGTRNPADGRTGAGTMPITCEYWGEDFNACTEEAQTWIIRGGRAETIRNFCLRHGAAVLRSYGYSKRDIAEYQAQTTGPYTGERR